MKRDFTSIAKEFFKRQMQQTKQFLSLHLHMLRPALYASSPACAQAGSQSPMAAARIRHSPTAVNAQCTRNDGQRELTAAA
jgi:hypothetical protein